MIARIEHPCRQGEKRDGWAWDSVHQFCLRLARRYARNGSEAEDIAQEAVLRAWRRRSSLRDIRARNQWLATIVRNEAYRVQIRRRPAPIGAIDTEQGADDERVLATVERADLRQAVAELNEPDRELISLRYGEDLTQGAIARRLGVPEGTVKVRLHRVRQRLREQIAAP